MASKDVVVCPRIHIKLDIRKNIAYRCNIFPSTTTLFQVQELDNVENRTCSCRKWDLTRVPCRHACAVVGFFGKNAEEFVDRQYFKEVYMHAYEFSIPPLPSEKFWLEVDFPLDPPPNKIQPGKPKNNRKKDPHADPKKPGKLTRHGCSTSCGICNRRVIIGGDVLKRLVNQQKSKVKYRRPQLQARASQRRPGP